MRGVVIALNDVTDLSRAERVLAWGEMARQVAHEIKNPLTPMRLGLQHLRRVYRDRREDFDRTLEETAERMLAEIDRLDTIARAFSRFAAPASDTQPLDRIDLGQVVGEVVQLYRLAEEGCEVELKVEPPAYGAGRADEVKEVLVNLLENARNADARRVLVTVRSGEIAVADDGTGHRAGPASPDLRAAVLDDHERIGTRARDREATGGGLGRLDRDWKRDGAGNDDRGAAAGLACGRPSACHATGLGRTPGTQPRR